MYNPEDTAEALKDLLSTAHNNNGKKLSYKELSNEINKKTGVYISDASLCDYANGTKNKAMSIKNLVALADYFEVSFDFLIGRSINRKPENIDIGNRIGLSDSSIELLESFNESPNTNQKGENTTNGYIHLLDTLLSNMEFYNLLMQLSLLQSMKQDTQSEESIVSYSPEYKQYIYPEQQAESNDFLQFEKLREKLYGKKSSIISDDQYQSLLKFNATQSLTKIMDLLVKENA